MLPILPPDVDFKKEYNFIWYLQLPIEKFSKFSGIQNKFLELANPTMLSYISQMCSQVNLPDDEVELDMVAIGNIDYPVPIKMKRGDVTVTYLEDTINTVYNYHKFWQNLIRDCDSLYMNPLAQFTCQAYYIPFDNSLTSIEYKAIVSKWNPSEELSSRNGLDVLPDLHIKPTSIVKYPQIYPSRISRGSVNKQGSNISTVSVTYTRVPIINKTKALRKFNG